MLFCAGGYDLLGRTKDQIKSSQQVNDAKSACEALKLDALVLIGGLLSTLSIEDPCLHHMI